MESESRTAQQALENSGLKLECLTHEQRATILTQLEQTAFAQTGSDYSCMACKIGLIVVVAAPLATMLAVCSAAVAPELPVIVTIASLFGVNPVAVVAVINTVLATGVTTTVQEIISKLCKEFGACGTQ